MEKESDELSEGSSNCLRAPRVSECLGREMTLSGYISGNFRSRNEAETIQALAYLCPGQPYIIYTISS